ncbi:LamG-like jellyroll fold domain-containing protein [Marinobacter sp.]|uniref:DUF7483 domain-containing protein n=1 Tax=Marinobacter sp. TaxID=50741 RepID=UPI000C89C5A2|nr:LamG-like jellyroll fold domain-containing protein [Marinobacter sp.]MAB51361.1 hypothetical protein [Marinobacter sp.]
MSNLFSSGGAGNVGASGITQQSLKFNDNDSQYLARTPASAGNRQTWTWSAWVKRGNLGSTQVLFGTQADGSNIGHISFESDDTLKVNNKASTTGDEAKTDMVFRDCSAWYHIVIAFDGAQSTQADRTTFYVNGVQQSRTTVSSKSSGNGYLNLAAEHAVGSRGQILGNYFDGYLADIHFIDGQALDASSFGETVDGYWKAKDYAGTYGTNGFHLTFQDDVVSEGFNAVAYSGTGVAQSISGLGFAPDFVWVKERTNTSSHILSNSLSGATKLLSSNSTDTEQTDANKFSSFDADGFSVGTSGAVNASGDTYIGWCWKAGGAPTATNSAGAGATPTAGSVKIDGSNLGSALAGSIPATKLSANTSKGFSIVQYTGNGTNGTIAHGLSSAPTWIIVKNRDTADNWPVWHSGIDITKYIKLNANSAASTPTNARWNDTAPTSTVFSVGDSSGDREVNKNNEKYIAFCWTDISGYSKFGSYSGTGSNHSVALGFRPAFVMLKRTDSTFGWVMLDNTRDPDNIMNSRLDANSNGDESSGERLRFTSTGFDVTAGTDAAINNSGSTYLYMAFADTREAAFFKDVTTNGNHFTPVNLDYRDSLPDSPANNFAVMNPLDKDPTWTLSEGNLKVSLLGVAGDDENIASTMAIPNSKLIYFEAKPNNSLYGAVGIAKLGFAELSAFSVSGATVLYLGGGGNAKIYVDGSILFDTGATWSLDIIGVAVDMSNSKVWFSKNGTYLGSGTQDPETNTGGFSISSDEVMPYGFKGNSNVTQSFTFNFGQDSTFAGAKPMGAFTDDSELGTFQYQPPVGFKSLCSANLPEPTIVDGSEYFNTVLYTGNNNSLAVSGVGFQPDFIWAKSRSGSRDHILVDEVRGATKMLSSNLTAAEVTGTDFASFDSDGFSLNAKDTTGGLNSSGDTYVAWNWLAGTAFSNDASATGVGTIDSSGQVNTTAGFSIVSYVGSSSNQTVAHGLSSAPEMILVKERTSTSGWFVYTSPTGAGKYLGLHSTTAESSSTASWNNTAPTSSVFSVGTSGGTNQSSQDYIAYCFHSVAGYSKVGSYTGNGSTDGPFLYMGFEPSFFLAKRSNGVESWFMIDNKRHPFNDGNIPRLRPNQSGAEAEDASIAGDFLSNGFKIRATQNMINTSGAEYIYLAFAETPQKFANAR